MTRRRQRLIAAVLAIAALLTLSRPAQAATLSPGASAVTQPAVTTYQRDDGWPGLVVFTIGEDQFAYYAFNRVPRTPGPGRAGTGWAAPASPAPSPRRTTEAWVWRSSAGPSTTA
ncbi:hypothetical protein AB0H12_35240 [Actinosynnema sp. NPDC023794]